MKETGLTARQGELLGLEQSGTKKAEEEADWDNGVLDFSELL